jgi:integration host factor subunit alpha
MKQKTINITKKELATNISSKIGLPTSYIILIIDDLIEILKQSIKKKNTNIKNFGTFKKINKSERMGRNPKTKQKYIITARKSISFSSSTNLIIK